MGASFWVEGMAHLALIAVSYHLNYPAYSFCSTEAVWANSTGMWLGWKNECTESWIPILWKECLFFFFLTWYVRLVHISLGSLASLQLVLLVSTQHLTRQVKMVAREMHSQCRRWTSQYTLPYPVAKRGSAKWAAETHFRGFRLSDDLAKFLFRKDFWRFRWLNSYLLAICHMLGSQVEAGMIPALRKFL